MYGHEGQRADKKNRFHRALSVLQSGGLERNSAYLVLGAAGTMTLGFAFRVLTTRSFPIQGVAYCPRDVKSGTSNFAKQSDHHDR